MRVLRPFTPLLAALLLIVSLVSVASASIGSTGGDVVVDADPLAAPGIAGSVAYNALKSPNVWAFDEQHDVVLASPITPDIGAPIPAGTRVDSHYLHLDAAGTSAYIGAGTITFSQPILGVITGSTLLSTTDPALGLPGMNYDGVNAARGAAEIGDTVTLVDAYTLSVSLRVTNGRDDLRVITAAPLADGDGDGVPDSADNCVDVANPSQSDVDGDGIGDACDADTMFWADWQGGDLDPGSGFQGKGTITTPSSSVTVTYTNPAGIAFYQPSGGPDYYQNGRSGRNPATSPFTSSSVSNIPTTSDIVALRYAGLQTLAFSDGSGDPVTVANPVFSYVSLNGNGYGFDQDFDILSFGDPSDGNDCGYWGCGTSYKQVVDLGDGNYEYRLLGTGEPHGTLRFRGSFDTLTWRSLSDEYWNGFTVGVAGLASEVPDTDGDGYSDTVDVFPTDPTEWADFDEDGVGDNSDAFPHDATESADTDGDGVGDNTDVCPGTASGDAVDANGCSAAQLDADGDGVPNADDNCENAANADQADLDGDGIGDACDEDIDGDGVLNGDDAFPTDPTESADTDGDGVGDNADNCVDVANTDQADLDGDGIGDACDEDIDGDGLSNAEEAILGTDPLDADSDDDGVLDGADAFPLSDTSASVLVGACEPGVGNHLFASGATFNDLIAAAIASAGNHGKVVSAITQMASGWKDAGLISGREKGAITSCVARSSAGKK